MRKVFYCVIIFFIASAIELHADPSSEIPGIYSTGVDDYGNTLAGGETDPHYMLVSSDDNNFPGPLTKVVISGTYPMNIWIKNNEVSKWIAPRSDAGEANSKGIYIYRITFDLSKFKSGSAVIAGMWTTDDNGVEILLNGKRTENFTPLAAFYGMYPFRINNGFNEGVNTLDFVVNNVVSSTGIRVEITGKADPKDFVMR